MTDRNSEKSTRCGKEFAAAEDSTRRAQLVTASFAYSMLIVWLALPFVYSEKPIELWPTILQVFVWLIVGASWIYLGILAENRGSGIAFRPPDAGIERRFGSALEIALFLLVFTPACFLYIHLCFLHNGYLGFNYVLLFIVGGLSVLVFPLWLSILFLIIETSGWWLLGYLMWGGWMKVVDLVTTLSGFLFSAMMFYMLRRERASRFHSEELARKLDEANEALRRYSGQIEELSATQERNRIAREIHDTLGHALTVINMQLETAKALSFNDPEKASAFIEKAQRMTQKGLADVRSSVASLRSSPLDGKSLEQALQTLVDGTRATGLEARLERVGQPRPLSFAAENALYRCAQEGLTNARKHAQARSVTLTLDYTKEDALAMTVSDDGVGCAAPSGGFGLVGIRERIQLLGGSAEVESIPQKGFTLRIALQA